MKRNKKIKKERKSRLFFLLLWLFVLGISLGTYSYAWFTSNRLVSIGLMDVEVKAQNGIEISSDGVTWKSLISIDDLVSAIDTYPNNINQLPTILEPVSTIGDVSNGLLRMFYGDVTNDKNNSEVYNLIATEEVEELSVKAESDKRFLAFDIFIKTNTPTDLYLTGDSGVTYQEKSVGIENATRFAFVIEGTTPVESAVGTIQNLKTNNKENVYIWEPNYDTHTEYGILNAKNVYGIDITNLSEPVKYDGIKNSIDGNLKVTIENANKTKFPNYFDSVNVDYYTKNGLSNNIEVFSLIGGVTKIRVYMWIEGQDVDCENNASVGKISLNLGFSTNPA